MSRPSLLFNFPKLLLKIFFKSTFWRGYSLQANPPGYVPAREGNQSTFYVHHVRYFQPVSDPVISAEHNSQDLRIVIHWKSYSLGSLWAVHWWWIMNVNRSKIVSDNRKYRKIMKSVIVSCPKSFWDITQVCWDIWHPWTYYWYFH